MEDIASVSAVITTHNRSQLLRRAINSVLNQTYGDLEIIVVDDGSSDGTRDVVQPMAQQGTLRYIRIDTPRGANHARNMGLRAATGRYLAYLDDDDVWSPHKLEHQVQVLDCDPGVAIVGCWFESGGVPCQVPESLDYRDLLSGNLIGGFSMCMFRRAEAVAAGGMDEQLRNAQDWDMWLRLAQKGRVAVIQQPLVWYDSAPGGRISVRSNRADHYANYLKVVHRHQSGMRFWTWQKHLFLAAYHSTPSQQKVTRFLRGIGYAVFRTIDELALALRAGGRVSGTR